LASPFDHDITFRRLWRRAVSSYPVVKNAQYERALQRLYDRNPERVYAALKALGDDTQHLQPAEIQAFVEQLLAFTAHHAQVEPHRLLDVLGKLDAPRAWRWFNFGVRHTDDVPALTAYLRCKSAASSAILEGLDRGLSAYDVEPVLRYYADALGEGALWPLRFVPHDSTALLDDEALYLPDHLRAYPAPSPSHDGQSGNLHFVLYKWLITHELGHRHQGTYRWNGSSNDNNAQEALGAFFQTFSDPQWAEALFHLFEDVRVEARLLEQYPGFRVDRDRLLAWELRFRPEPGAPHPQLLEALIQHLHWGKSQVSLTHELDVKLKAIVASAQLLYRPETTVERVGQFTEEVYDALNEALDAPPLSEPLPVQLFPYEPPLRLAPAHAPPSSKRSFVGVGTPQLTEDPDAPESSPPQHGGAQGTCHYDEWDYHAGDYRAQWCALHDLLPDEAETLGAVSAPRVAQVRRAFEWMAQEEWTRQKRQLEGDELDLDAWVEGIVDRRAGQPFPEKLYTKKLRNARSLCAAVVLDQSDSTARLTPNNQTVIKVEQEALRYLCEALEAVRDEYAVFSYSGEGPERVNSFLLKGFDEPYGTRVQRRLHALKPLSQNRDGCMLRHVARQLRLRDARTRLLLHITDGKPWDHGYTQRYALEDTKKAIREARTLGVKVFGVVCDPHASAAQVKNTYGKGRVVILNKIDELTALLLGLYRKITW